MAGIDEQLRQIRRMWTFRWFVWGFRLAMIGFLVMIPGAALKWDPLLPWIVVLFAGGLLLGVPFRVWAYWKLDIPSTTLFAHGIREALPQPLRDRPVIRFPIRNPTAVRIARRMAAATEVERDPATSVEQRLQATRRTWPYRTGVWGYRIMLLSLLFCGGNLFRGTSAWLVLWPVLTFLVGFVMTVPMQWVVQMNLRVPRGKVVLRALSDTFRLGFH